MTALILVVEDEQDLVRTLEYNLHREGFETKSAMMGQDGLEKAWQHPLPNLVLLDLMLPDMSGFEVCRQLRQHPSTKKLPIVMLTAKSEEIDRVVGFEVGVDDYVTKPFSVRELMLRIRAILRRSQTQEAEKEEEQSESLIFGELRLDFPGHQVWCGGEELRLTALEFRLLRALLAQKGRVKSRNSLLDEVWGIKADVTTRTVDTHVKRLREKLGEAGRYIETLRGVGYRWSANPDET